MSWLFSQALVAAYSAENCLDGEPSVPLSVMPTPHKFWHRDKTTEPSNLSRFGLTCAVLTADRGEALLTSYLADFHAKTSAPQEKARELTESAADSGQKWPGLFAILDRDTSSWKTPQYSLLGDLDAFSETWPRSGTMRNGQCYLLPTSALRTCAKESGYWQTPVADDAVNRIHGKYNSRGEPKLSAQVLLPTPTATNAHQGINSKAGGTNKGKPLLPMAAMMWPTPVASEAKAGARTPDGKRGARLTDVVKRPDLWPTPTASMMTTADMEQAKYHSSKRPSYQDAKTTYPTPNTIDAKGGTRRAQDGKKHQTQLCHVVGGQLNPTWVEWLMGWPLGWTDLEPSATDKYPWPPQQHSEY